MFGPVVKGVAPMEIDAARSGSVYLDEAGNTGLNLLDPDQPTYVLAGWVVPSDRYDAARSAVTAISDESGSRDLKGSRMMGSALGRQRVERLVSNLVDLECYPVYSIYEKRYAVAGKIVETFLDSEYNDQLPTSFNGNVFAKRALAQQLYDLPDGSMAPAWEAIRAVDAGRMGDSLRVLIERCRILGADELVRLLAGAKSHVERNAADLAEMQADPVARHSQALPATSLITLAGDIDTIADSLGLTRMEIVHDETSSFGPNLEWWFQLVSGPEPVAEPSETILPHGRRFRVGYSAVRSLRFEVSKDEPLVQAADVLAALLATAPRELAGTIDSTTPGLVDEYAHLALLSDKGYPVPCYIVGSTQFFEEVAGVIARSARRQVQD